MPYRYQFRCKHFWKYLIPNLLYNFLGPLASLVLLSCYSKCELHNMGFWGCSRRLYWWLNFYWITYISILAIDQLFDLGSLKSLYANFIFLLALTKTLMISTRYAYTSSDQLKKFSERRLGREELQQEYLIHCWAKTNPAIAEEEIREAMWRNNVEDWDFKLTFGEVPPHHLVSKISPGDVGYDFDDSFQLAQYCRQMKAMVRQMRQYFLLSLTYNESVARSQYHPRTSLEIYENSRTIKHSSQEMRSSCRSLPHHQEVSAPPPVVTPNLNYVGHRELLYRDLVTPLCASKMVREMVLASLPWRPNITKICLWYCFGHELVPIVSLALDHQNLLHLSVASYVFLGLFTVANFLIYFDITRLLMVGLVDFERRKFLMRTLSRVLTAEPVAHFQLNYYVPSINVLDSQSIYAWYEMRKVCVSIGERFLVKILSNFFFVTMGVIVSVLLLILTIFKLLTLGLPATFLVGIVYHSSLFFIYIMRMIFVGAQINGYAARHKEMLLQHWYQLNSIRNKGVATFLTASLRCDVLQKIQRWVQLVQEEEGEEQLLQRIDQSCKALKVIIRKVSNDQEKGNLKILGVPLSHRMVKAIYGFVLSIFVAYLIEITLGFS